LLLRRMKTQRFVLVAYPVFDPVFDLVKFQCFPEQRLICWPHVVRQTSMIHARLDFCF
jgi:hypothetical protein